MLEWVEGSLIAMEGLDLERSEADPQSYLIPNTKLISLLWVSHALSSTFLASFFLPFFM